MSSSTELVTLLKAETLEKRGAVSYRKLESGGYVSVKRFDSGEWGNDTFQWSFKKDLLDEVQDITEAQAVMLLDNSDIDYVLNEMVPI